MQANRSGKRVDRQGELERIVQEHARFLYAVAHSVLRHPQDAEDAVQEALLKLHRATVWPEMREERAYLARTVWRAAIDRSATRKTARRETSDEAVVLQMVHPGATPEAAAAEGDERALLHALIDALEPELRQTLLLAAIEEMSSREVGEVLGIPEGTVRTRLMRARALLRGRFEAMRVNGVELKRRRQR